MAMKKLKLPLRKFIPAAIFLSVAGIIALVFVLIDCVSMPGHSYAGPLPPLLKSEAEIQNCMKRHVSMLAGTIGERNMGKFDKLVAAAAYIEKEFQRMGYTVKSQEYVLDGKTVRNLEVELPGTTKPDEIVVVGAHYDSVPDCAGANDNATGIAGVLELARLLSTSKFPRTLRFVAFTNEEDPYFETPNMGSYHYATRCHARHENVVGMLAVETFGYYSDKPGSQMLPPLCDWLYPNRGDFLWFVGNQDSKQLIHLCIDTFRKHSRFPSQGVSAPDWIEGVDWCDQLYFWEYGYPGLMVTDSAPYRYPYYHKPEDTPDKIDYERTARVVSGLASVVRQMSSSQTSSESQI